MESLPGGFMFLIVIIVAYFIPAIVAKARNVRNAGAILVLNIFLGWTVIGWVVALIWSFMNDAKSATE